MSISELWNKLPFVIFKFNSNNSIAHIDSEDERGSDQENIPDDSSLMFVGELESHANKASDLCDNKRTDNLLDINLPQVGERLSLSVTNDDAKLGSLNANPSDVLDKSQGHAETRSAVSSVTQVVEKREGSYMKLRSEDSDGIYNDMEKEKSIRVESIKAEVQEAPDPYLDSYEQMEKSISDKKEPDIPFVPDHFDTIEVFVSSLYSLIKKFPEMVFDVSVFEGDRFYVFTIKSSKTKRSAKLRLDINKRGYRLDANSNIYKNLKTLHDDYLSVTKKITPEYSGSRRVTFRADNKVEKSAENIVKKNLMGVDSIDAQVIGVTFTNPDGSSRQGALKRLRIGDSVSVFPEKNNPHHKNAYQVLSSFGQIGYLDRVLADRVSRAGRYQYTATVLAVGASERGALGSKIRIILRLAVTDHPGIHRLGLEK